MRDRHNRLWPKLNRHLHPAASPTTSTLTPFSGRATTSPRTPDITTTESDGSSRSSTCQPPAGRTRSPCPASRSDHRLNIQGSQLFSLSGRHRATNITVPSTPGDGQSKDTNNNGKADSIEQRGANFMHGTQPEQADMLTPLVTGQGNGPARDGQLTCPPPFHPHLNLH